MTKIQYEEFEGAELIELLRKKNPGNRHPRLLAIPDTFHKIALQKGKNPFMKKVWESELAKAEACLGESVSIYEISDGIRLLPVSRRILSRVQTLSLIYCVTGIEKYAKRAWEELEAAAGFPDWNPYHFLDTAEMCAAFALGYDWLFHWLKEEQKQVLRTAIIDKGLKQVLTDYHDEPRKRTFDWCHGSVIDNWSFVCNGGVAMAALAVGDEEAPDICGEVLAYSLSNIERALPLFAPDGAWREGLIYWEYATLYFTYHIASLESALGSDFGRFREPGLKNAADYVEALNGNAAIFNFSDCDEEESRRASHLLWFARKLNRPEIGRNRIRDVMEGKISSFSDLLWYDAEFFQNAVRQMPLDFLFESIDTVTMRSQWSKEGIYIGFHGGYNGETHSHLDIGSFVLDAGGQRFIADLGADDYNLPGDIYDRYRYRAEGHNTLVIGPDGGYDQSLNAAGHMIYFNSTDDEACAVCNMTEAYPGKAKAVIRTIRLKDRRSRMFLQDEIILEEPQELYWFAHSSARASLLPGKRQVILEKNGRKLMVSLLNTETMFFSIMAAEPLPGSPVVAGQNPNKQFCKLAIYVPDFKKGCIQVEFTMIKSD